MIIADTSLNLESKKATIFQLFNIQLDFAMGNLIDMALELYADKTENPQDDYTVVGWGFDAVINPFQGMLGRWLFNKWTNIDPIWSTSIADNGKIGLLEIALMIGGGMQMSYLFDSSLKTVELLTKLIMGLIPGPEIFSISNKLFVALGNYKEMISLFDFGYSKYAYGFGLAAYHSINMYFWANSINSL